MTATQSAITRTRKMIRPSRRSFRSETRRPPTWLSSPQRLSWSATETSSRLRPSLARVQQFLALPASRFLGDARSFRDHALQLFHFAAKLRFALSEFFLFLVERRSGFRRSAAHAESLSLRGHPKENQERDDPKNNQRQSDGETDLHPLREGFPAGQSRKTRRGLRQIQVG